MNVLIAIDSFKGSMTSLEAGEACARGVRRAVPSASVRVLPMADGGEGTAAALIAALGGETVRVTVSGPYGAPVQASYGWIPAEGLAVMEMAAAAGITLSERREPARASTRGVGQMIAHALSRGCRKIMLGIGGSATNDGGIGMLSALGWRFLDESGALCGDDGAALARVASIDASRARPELVSTSFQVACDVRSPLCGATGSTRVFGLQKGVRPEELDAVDAAMGNYAAATAAACGRDESRTPGAGAAGGLGFALISWFNARLCPGAAMVMDALGMDAAIAAADVVVTGEGRLDAQTSFGKVPAAVAACAARCGKPVIALAGSVSPDAGVCNDHGITAFFPILSGPVSLAQAMETETARANMARTAEQAFRLLTVR